MATPVIMPRQGQSVESCIISKWHKKVGDMVAEGDTLFSYETDKASFDEVSKVSGKMLAIFFEEGDDVECLLNVCVIGEDGA
ncbi:MAG: lipoyl domain-containing protein, partial [Oscillospiraceae bacterium]|nr:lipoyl domain-containing protein [Oscillospiraceae bacterium]